MYGNLKQKAIEGIYFTSIDSSCINCYENTRNKLKLLFVSTTKLLRKEEITILTHEINLRSLNFWCCVITGTNDKFRLNTRSLEKDYGL